MNETRGKRYSETAKQYLGKVRVLERRINVTADELEHIHALRTKITSTLKECTIMSSVGGDRRNDATVTLIELEEKLNDLMSQYAKTIEQTNRAIDCLYSERQHDLMCRRYILGHSFQRIAKDMSIELDSVYKLHGRALWKIGQWIEINNEATQRGKTD